MRITALSGAAVALALASAPMATAAQAGVASAVVSSGPSTPSAANAASPCGETYGRYPHLCIHRHHGNNHRRFGNPNGHSGSGGGFPRR